MKARRSRASRRSIFPEALSADRFLAEYWQKQPLLIRQALPDLRPPISAEELAGLACEPCVESRLIVRDPKTDHWDLRHGPFGRSMFRTLPGTHWTLLVQAVDHWVPAAAELLDRFDFIPSWRLDDLMISYAAEQGGVGPHYDHYDVFLIQLSGRRQWEVGEFCDDESPRRPDLPLLILAEWRPRYRWVLEPGDLLYLPPRIGHHGLALGSDCMTGSVGFRAPSHADMLREFAEFLARDLSEAWRYADPDLVPQDNPGWISPRAIEKVRRVFRRYWSDADRMAEWFGCAVTAPKYPEDQEPPRRAYRMETLRRHLARGGRLRRNEGSRFAYQQHGDTYWLFVDGRCWRCSNRLGNMVLRLCASRTIALSKSWRSEEHLRVLLDLLNRGSLAILKS